MNEKHFYDELTTKRLRLRKFHLDDAQRLSDLLQDREVPSTTLLLPYPCKLEDAKKLIHSYVEEQEKKTVIRWSITLLEHLRPIGAIKLVPNTAFNSGELGFWIGKDYWRKGYTIEAAEAVLEFAFRQLQLNRINAHAMLENVSSMKLLSKLGFKKEGVHPELVLKWGNYKDVATFGLLQRDYLRAAHQ